MDYSQGVPLTTRLRGRTSVHLAQRIALSGDTLLAGVAPDGSSGEPHVFVRSGDKWIQQATLLGDDTKDTDQFGFAVSLSGDTAVVGALEAEGTKGAAYVFVRSGTTWAQQAKLTSVDAAVGDRLGWSVSISGDTILLGAPRRNRVRGAVFVFTRTGTTWTQQSVLTPDDASVNSFFGINLAANGDDAIVGASFAESNRGEAYVFHRTGTSWAQQATLLPADRTAGAMFGGAVAIHGERAIVGASGYDIGSPGAAYVFVRSSGTWTQEAKLMGDGDFRFGGSVALHKDIAVIGAADSDDNVGRGYVFAPMAGTWAQQAKLVPADGTALDHFGSSAAIHDSFFVFGSPYHAMNRGAAYVYGYTGKAEPDAGVADGGPDTGASDAGIADATPDAPMTTSESGCGCAVPRRERSSGLAALVLGLLLLSLRRRV